MVLRQFPLVLLVKLFRKIEKAWEVGMHCRGEVERLG
jgi:hypothetical protein